MEHEALERNSDELLHRQIHPTFVLEDGTVTSAAFKPFPKDNGELSVDRGSCVTPAESFRRFNATPACLSAAVYSVTCEECSAVALSVVTDPVEASDTRPANPCHALIVGFSDLPSRNAQERVAKRLRDAALSRGRQHP